MNPLEICKIGNTGVAVTKLGMGGAAIGGLYTDVPYNQAIETIQLALKLGVSYMDTSPLYGLGKSEIIFGQALAGIPRDEYVISSKVGRILTAGDSRNRDLINGSLTPFVNLPQRDVTFDFSRDGVLRSIDESLNRLGLNSIDIVMIHDPDSHYRQAIDEAFPVLADLRSQGIVKAIGVGMNQWQLLTKFAIYGDFDCFLLAGRYTLLDHSGLVELLPLCSNRNISVIIGGPYNSGILASNLSSEAMYFYSHAPHEVLERTRRIKAICDNFNVPLKAAALQFGLLHPAVASTIPGSRSVSEIKENLQMIEYPIPRDFWSHLKQEQLIPEDAPT